VRNNINGPCEVVYVATIKRPYYFGADEEWYATTDIRLDEDEAREFDRDPDGYAARHFGLTTEEYREWIANVGRPCCGCLTMDGYLCGNGIGRLSMEAAEWKQKHRRSACTIHKNKPLALASS
jgi:hypothetical protein